MSHLCRTKTAKVGHPDRHSEIRFAPPALKTARMWHAQKESRDKIKSLAHPPPARKG